MLFFNTLKLRNVNEPYKLIGPSFSRAKNYRFSIDETEICIGFPKHKSERNFPKPRNPKKTYQLDNYSLPSMIPSKKGWGSLLCASRVWDFYGPLFAGKMATITMALTINSPKELKSDVSFFHPRSLEKLIGDYLSFRYEDEVDYNGQRWLAPTDWQPLSINQPQAAKFRAVSNYQANYYDRYLVTSISDTQLLVLSFNLSWNNVNPSNPNRSESHDISNMEQLCDDIMDSLEVKLSAKALAQQQAALAGLENTSLVSDYPPLKWVQKKELTL